MPHDVVDPDVREGVLGDEAKTFVHQTGGRGDRRRRFAFDDLRALAQHGLGGHRSAGPEQAVQLGGGLFSRAFVIGKDAGERRIRKVAEKGIVVDAKDGKLLGNVQPELPGGLKS